MEGSSVWRGNAEKEPSFEKRREMSGVSRAVHVNGRVFGPLNSEGTGSSVEKSFGRMFAGLILGNGLRSAAKCTGE